MPSLTPMSPNLGSSQMLPDQEAVFAVLRNCRDPEIPLNLVDLGLIYGVEITPAKSDAGGAEVRVKMTLTSPGCPMSHAISSDVQRRVAELAGVSTAKVETVWEPAWHPGLISPEGKRQLQIAS